MRRKRHHKTSSRRARQNVHRRKVFRVVCTQYEAPQTQPGSYLTKINRQRSRGGMARGGHDNYTSNQSLTRRSIARRRAQSPDPPRDPGVVNADGGGWPPAFFSVFGPLLSPPATTLPVDDGPPSVPVDALGSISNVTYAIPKKKNHSEHIQ